MCVDEPALGATLYKSSRPPQIRQFERKHDNQRTIMRLLGIDLVHFGIVIDVNMEVGLCHPPVGLNLYVASMIAGMRITDI